MLPFNPGFLTCTLLPYLCCRHPWLNKSPSLLCRKNHPRCCKKVSASSSSSSSSSLQQQQQQQQQKDPDPSREQQLSPVRIFYKTFDNEVIRKRIQEADRHPPEESCQDAVTTALPCINMHDLDNKAALRLQKRSGSSLDENNRNQVDDMFDFQKLLRENGGWCLVELLDEQVPVMDAMWDCIEQLHVIGTDEPTTMRRQVLSRRVADDNDANDGGGVSQGGYNHLEIALANDSISRIQEILGKQAYQEVDEAFRLIGGIGAAFCAAASGLDVSTLQCLWDDTINNTTFSGSSQRLARYVEGRDVQESLRSHCDWSFATIVPVSDLAGLEVYNPSERCWVRPELRAMNDLFGSEENRYRLNSRFVVVMAGKWLELLCRGQISSTIHRVTRANGRFSAPFFLRPKAQVFDRAEMLQFDKRDWKSSVALVSDFLLREAVNRD